MGLFDLFSKKQRKANQAFLADQRSQQVTNQTQVVAAATEEQSATTEEIAGASHSLAKMAEELTEAVRRFRIR